MSSFMESFFGMSFDDISKCGMFTFKLVLLLIFFSMVFTSINMAINPAAYNISFENFSNDQFFSYKDTIHPNYSYYQMAELTSDDQDTMLFGSAKRIVAADAITKQTTIFIDVICDLYVLNGNPFGKDNLLQDKLDQHYRVYLKNKTDVLFLGELGKLSDGAYQLHYKSSDPATIEKLVGYNQVQITYETADKKSVILNGMFTL